MRYVVLPIMIFMLSTKIYGQQETWNAPEWADTLSNPFESDDANILIEGQNLYIMLCASCHGENGDGGGGAGQAFNPPPSDFTKDMVQGQSDGAIFWKLSEGNPPGMLSYKRMLSDEERWQIVTYLRQFARSENE